MVGKWRAQPRRFYLAHKTRADQGNQEGCCAATLTQTTRPLVRAKRRAGGLPRGEEFAFADWICILLRCTKSIAQGVDDWEPRPMVGTPT